MHLNHRLPCNTLASQLKIIPLNKRYTPNATGIFANGGDDFAKHLAYFQSAFYTILTEFSQTEVRKHENPVAKSFFRDKFLSDRLRDLPEVVFGVGPHNTNSLRHNPIGENHLNYSYWISRASETSPPSFSTADGDLADVVKTLIALSASLSSADEVDQRHLGQEAFTSLMRLSQHAEIPLSSLNHLSWGHSFGIEHIAQDTLRIYLLLNLVAAIKQQKDSSSGSSSRVSLLDIKSFRKFAEASLIDFDYPAQNLLHCQFWKSLGVTADYFRNPRPLVEGMGFQLDPTNQDGQDDVQDTGVELRRYLCTCFSILYKYNILLVSWFGHEHARQFWDEEIEHCLAFRAK